MFWVVEDSKTSGNVCEDLLGYLHKQAKQKTEESGVLIFRILLQQVWRIYCPQTRTLNITMDRDRVIITINVPVVYMAR